MRTVRNIFTASALGASLLTVACAGESEEKISADAVPPAVMNAVRARFPNATVTEAARESEDGKTIYEVSLMDGGRKVDVSATADGQIVAVEGALPQTALPAAVAQALAAKYPGATYKIIEDVSTKEGGAERLAYYEVLVETADKKLIEVEIAADGKILKETKKSSVER